MTVFLIPVFSGRSNFAPACPATPPRFEYARVASTQSEATARLPEIAR